VKTLLGTAQAPAFMPTNLPKARNSPPRSQTHLSEDCSEEVKRAAQWWSSKMKQHDLAATEVQAFEAAVHHRLMAKCCGHWYPTDPLRGSGYRSLSNDLSVDPVFLHAAAETRIRDIDGRLPKAIMWVNPLSVKVQMENSYHPEVLYSVRASNEGADRAGSDEDAI